MRLEGRIDASNKVAPLYALEFDYVDGRVSERRLLGGSSYLNAPNACRVTVYRYRVDGYDAVCLDPTGRQSVPRSDGVFSVRVTGDQTRLRFEYLDAAGRLMKNGAGFAAAEVVYRGGDLREIRFLDRDNELADAEIREIRAAVVRYETLIGVADQPFVAEHLLTADGRTEDSNFLANTPAPSMFCEVGLGRNGEPMAPEDCRPLFESATQTNPR